MHLQGALKTGTVLQSGFVNVDLLNSLLAISTYNYIWASCRRSVWRQSSRDRSTSRRSLLSGRSPRTRLPPYPDRSVPPERTSGSC